MLKKFRDLMSGRLCLGVSKSGIALLHTSGIWRKNISVLSDQEFSGNSTSLLDQLRIESRKIFSENKCAGKPLTIILADELVRLFFTTPPSNATSMHDYQAAANARFQVLFGESNENWQIKADWNAQHPFLTCAIPQDVLKSLQQVAVDSDMTIISITTQFLKTWNTWCNHLPKDSWFGVVNNQHLTIGVVEENRLLAVRETLIPLHGNNPQWIKEYIHREALRFNISSPQQLKLCGNWNNLWILPATDNSSLSDTSLFCSNLDKASPAGQQFHQSTNVTLAYFGLQ